MKQRRQPTKRKLRADFVRLCNDDAYAALLLDFLAAESGMDHDAGYLLQPTDDIGDYILLLPDALSALIIVRPTRTEAVRAIALLERLQYIEAHPNVVEYPGFYCLNARKLYTDFYAYYGGQPQ